MMESRLIKSYFLNKGPKINSFDLTIFKQKYYVFFKEFVSNEFFGPHHKRF